MLLRLFFAINQQVSLVILVFCFEAQGQASTLCPPAHVDVVSIVGLQL